MMTVRPRTRKVRLGGLSCLDIAEVRDMELLSKFEPSMQHETHYRTLQAFVRWMLLSLQIREKCKNPVILLFSIPLQFFATPQQRRNLAWWIVLLRETLLPTHEGIRLTSLLQGQNLAQTVRL